MWRRLCERVQLAESGRKWIGDVKDFKQSISSWISSRMQLARLRNFASNWLRKRRDCSGCFCWRRDSAKFRICTSCLMSFSICFDSMKTSIFCSWRWESLEFRSVTSSFKFAIFSVFSASDCCSESFKFEILDRSCCRGDGSGSGMGCWISGFG